MLKLNYDERERVEKLMSLHINDRARLLWMWMKQGVATQAVLKEILVQTNQCPIESIEEKNNA